MHFLDQLQLPSPVTAIKHPEVEKAGLRLLLKREDLIHPELGGNKWRKLRYNLQRARSLGKSRLLTFGGPHSNHLYATAAAGKLLGMPTLGLVRGEEPQPLTPTLAFAKSCGMELRYLSRSAYREKHLPSFQRSLQIQSDAKDYIIPEGGTNLLALQGCREIVEEFRVQQPEVREAVWCVPCGTGGTLAGITQALRPGESALGFACLKGGFLGGEVHKLLGPKNNCWKIIDKYHCGGFARYSEELIAFMRDFRQHTGVQLDPLYTGKMMWGLFDLIRRGYFPKGSTLVAVHTGGLQGIPGFEQRYGLEL